MRISASQKIHNILKQLRIHSTYTAPQLISIIRRTEPDITEGAVSGYLVRACEKGTLERYKRIKHPTRDQMIFTYRILSHEDWEFTGPGIGSKTGRELTHTTTHEPTEAEMHNAIQGTLKLEPVSETVTVPIMDIEYDDGSITDRLILLVHEIHALENKPAPTLKDYTSEELLAEIKSRIK